MAILFGQGGLPFISCSGNSLCLSAPLASTHQVQTNPLSLSFLSFFSTMDSLSVDEIKRKYLVDNTRRVYRSGIAKFLMFLEEEEPHVLSDAFKTELDRISDNKQRGSLHYT